MSNQSWKFWKRRGSDSTALKTVMTIDGSLADELNSRADKVQSALNDRIKFLEGELAAHDGNKSEYEILSPKERVQNRVFRFLINESGANPDNVKKGLEVPQAVLPGVMINVASAILTYSIASVLGYTDSLSVAADKAASTGEITAPLLTIPLGMLFGQRAAVYALDAPIYKNLRQGWKETKGHTAAAWQRTVEGKDIAEKAQNLSEGSLFMLYRLMDVMKASAPRLIVTAGVVYLSFEAAGHAVFDQEMREAAAKLAEKYEAGNAALLEQAKGEIANLRTEQQSLIEQLRELRSGSGQSSVEVTTATQQLSAAQTEYQRLKDIARQEFLQGDPTVNRPPGDGPYYRELVKDAERYYNETVKPAQDRLNELTAEQTRLAIEKSAGLKSQITTAEARLQEVNAQLKETPDARVYAEKKYPTYQVFDPDQLSVTKKNDLLWQVLSELPPGSLVKAGVVAALVLALDTAFISTAFAKLRPDEEREIKNEIADSQWKAKRALIEYSLREAKADLFDFKDGWKKSDIEAVDADRRRESFELYVSHLVEGYTESEAKIERILEGVKGLSDEEKAQTIAHIQEQRRNAIENLAAILKIAPSVLEVRIGEKVSPPDPANQNSEPAVDQPKVQQS